MNNLYSKLKEVKLFTGLNEAEYGGALACLNAKVREYKKGGILQLAGEPVKTVGIVLSGSLEISRTDYAGNRLIVGRMEYPQLFGEAITFADISKSPVTLIALEDCSILALDLKNLVNGSAFLCKHSRTVVTNLLGMIAEKNLFLSSRLELVTKKTTRAKLAAYLLQVMGEKKKTEIELPFNRNELADYLSVNRSAMSSELGRLRGEGVLNFRRSRVDILQPNLLSEIAVRGK